MKQELFDVIESELTLSGYEVMDVSEDSLIIRDAEHDIDYEIKVTELPG